MKKLVYIAGPLTTGGADKLVSNIVQAVKIADGLRVQFGDEVVPFVPHLSHLSDLIDPGHPYEFWMDWDLDMLEHCQALLRLRGASDGADREVARAQERGIPVFYEVGDLMSWVRGEAVV